MTEDKTKELTEEEIKNFYENTRKHIRLVPSAFHDFYFFLK